MSIWNGILTVSVSVGVLMVMLNLADFIVRPFQRQAIQTFLEELTLWIDDINENNLSSRLHDEDYQFLILIVTWWVACALQTAALAFSIKLGDDTKTAWKLLFIYFLWIFVALLIRRRGLMGFIKWASEARRRSRRWLLFF
ncbi:hypothetical protein [Dankookia sp. P2]|uniref:hypothetical protein n=1 Tax=Dankookia sp. P2 TaxID=3423955 RepID=UPI003D66F964